MPKQRLVLGLGVTFFGLAAACGAGDGAPGDAEEVADAADVQDTAVDSAPDSEVPDVPSDADDAQEDSASDTAEVEVIGPPPLGWVPHVRGTFNDWGTSAPMTWRGAGLYQVSVPISAGSHMFKIADDKWSLDTIYSTDARAHVEIPLDTPMPLVIATGYNNDAVLNTPAEGEYTFDLTVTVADGVPSLVLRVQQGNLTPVVYPDDSAVETFAGHTWAPHAVTGGSDRILAPDALLSALGIEVPSGVSAQYVFGDNIDGYYEGWTHAYTSASRYRMRVDYLFFGFASLIDGKLLDASGEMSAPGVDTAREPTGTTIGPHGVRTRFRAGAWEELVVHTHDHAITLHLHSDVPAPLSIVPRLNMRRTSTDTWQRLGDVMVYALEPELRHEGSPAFLAIAGDRPHTATGVDLEALPALADVVGITASSLKPIFTTTGPETDFRLFLGFGDTATAAAAKASTMAQRDTVGEELQTVYDLLTRGYLWTDDLAFNRGLMWSKRSALGMLVEELGAGLWAGLPWFKNNWGRDTFISLPGTLLVSGQFEAAKAVIRNFASLQNTDPDDEDFGRVPNVVNSLTDLDYNTTDGTPWLVREIEETVRYTGDTAFADEMFPVVDRYLSGAIAHHVDDEGFLTHGDTATWMDAALSSPGGELLPWSARGNRAVEIQALWYVSLRIGAAMATTRGEAGRAQEWSALADELKARFSSRFWDPDAALMADRVRADDSRDAKVRPNQLMLLSIPFEDRLVPADVEARVLRNAVNALLYPYGIASLDQTHPYFHPFHDNQPTFEKDAAYHNGTVWGWNAGFTISALTRYGRTEHAYALSRNLAEQVLSLGTRGSMSELLDAHPAATGALTPSGTFSQTWSVAEVVRNGMQDYLGFRPNLPAGVIVLAPSIPTAWTTLEAEAPFGAGATLSVSMRRAGATLTFTLQHDHPAALTLAFRPSVGGVRLAIDATLTPGAARVIVFDPAGPSARVDGVEQGALAVAQPSQDALVGELEFVTPNVDATFPTLEEDDYLRGVIERREFE